MLHKLGKISSFKNSIINNHTLCAIGFFIIFLIAIIFRCVNIGLGIGRYIDEIIPLRVIEYMTTSRTLNTNWINADLPDYFKYNQFNFSSYIICLKIFLDALDLFTAKLINVDIYSIYYMRFFSAILSIISVYIVYIISKKLFSNKISILSMIFYSLTLISVQDAHYARPESFMVFLTLFAFYIAINKKIKITYSVCLFSFIEGILISCKITMVLNLPFIIILFICCRISELRKFSHRKIVGLIICTIVFLFSGIFITMPYGVFEINNLLSGLKFLNNQYLTGHPPHSSKYDDSLFSIKCIIQYLYATYGILIFLPIVHLFVKIKEKSNIFILIFISYVVVFICFFSFQKVFFERNLSTIFPLISIVLSWYICKLSVLSLNNVFKIFRYLILTLTIAVMLSNVYIFSVCALKDSNLHVENEKNLLTYYEKLNIHSVAFNTTDFNDDYTSIYKLISYNDDFSSHVVNEFKNRGYKIVYIQHSYFRQFPVSTLFTYHSPNLIYFTQTDKSIITIENKSDETANGYK